MADNNTVVLKLRLDEAQAKIRIKELKEDIKSVGNFSDDYKAKVAALNLEEQKLINTREKLSKSTNALIGNNKTGLNGVSKASGSATAAAMELGRVVSDAPYGIRGMANNVSQLASQLFFMAGQQETATVATKSSTVATTTDTVAKGANTTATVVATGATIGFTGAVKMMWSALMGPMGVLLAIQAVIASLDFFYGANKKAEESSDKVTSALERQRIALRDLTNEYEDHRKVREKVIQTASKEREMLKVLGKEALDSSSTDERRAEALKKLIKLYPKYFKGLKIDDVKGIFAAEKQVNRILQNKLKLAEELNKAELIANDIQLEKIKIEQARALGQKNYKDRLVSLYAEQKQVRELIGIYATLDLELKEDKKPKGKGKTKLLEIKDFDKQVEDYLSQIASVSEKEEILNAKLNSEKVLIQEEYHLKKLGVKNEENKAKFKQQSDAYRVEYEAFLNQEVRLGNLTKKEAEVKLDKFDKDAKAQQDKSDANYKILLSKWNTYYSDKLFAALSGEMKVAETEEDANTKRLASINAFIEQYKVLSSSVSDFLQAESDRELTIEQNKTNVLNAELNDRLLNESLSADQRASIQNQIAQNDEKLRVKQEAIKRKAFNTQKAFNIAAALVDTYAAASSAYRNTLANPANALDPTVGLLRAKINAGIAMAGGLAQVAAIARQKYQSSSAATPVNIGGGGAGGGEGRAEPSFNIVGRSNNDQLLNAIQSQFDKPLKAYVVSGEVTNQQELDRNISSGASF